MTKISDFVHSDGQFLQAHLHNYNVRLFNTSPAVVVLIGRLMHRVTSITPSCFKVCDYVKINVSWYLCNQGCDNRGELYNCFITSTYFNGL